MRVEQLMSRDIWTCCLEDSLDRAAQIMWDHDCGCLPVVSGNGVPKLEGLLTDRDICMCALFRGRPLHDLGVSEAMAKDVQACKPTDSLRAAEQAMSARQVRRLPVVDEQNTVVGMISLADLAREAAQENHGPKPEVMRGEIGDTLAAICQPAGSRAS